MTNSGSISRARLKLSDRRGRDSNRKARDRSKLLLASKTGGFYFLDQKVEIRIRYRAATGIDQPLLDAPTTSMAFSLGPLAGSTA